MMYYFTTRLSLSLVVKEFKKLGNIWQSYWQNGDCVKRPIRIALLSSKMLVSADMLNNLCITDRNCYCCYVNKRINVSLLSTNIKLL